MHLSFLGYSWKTWFVIGLLMFLQGCCGPDCMMTAPGHQTDVPSGAEGGGQDVVTADLPFANSFAATCTQGPGGSYSHNGTSTRYGVDLDTPNDADVPVYAPVSGTAYVHADPDSGFGLHVNIDLHDGTFILLGHLSRIFVADGSEVGPGTLLGYEGSTGNSQGDHVHFGRQSGDPRVDAGKSRSLAGLNLTTSDLTAGTSVQPTPVADMTCALSGGHRYVSKLPVARRFPEGTLAKTAESPTVYRVASRSLEPFLTEESFLSRNYRFEDVVLTTDDALDCYYVTSPIADTSRVTAVRDRYGAPWLIVGADADPERRRYSLPVWGWQAVLKTWGVAAQTYDDVPLASASGIDLTQYPQSGLASLRTGALVSPLQGSAVYAVTDTALMPIVTWETFLMLGFGSRPVTEIDEGELALLLPARGNCATDLYCLTSAWAAECGADEDSSGFQTAGYDDEEEEPVETDPPFVDEPVEETEEEEPTPTPIDPPAPGTLTLTFTTPWARTAERITLSGEFTLAGSGPTGWQPRLFEATNASSLIYTQTVNPGDALRFSVEYVTAGVASWSCLGPFPPGNAQGSATAMVDGQHVGITPTADPTSSGCGLTVTVP